MAMVGASVSMLLVGPLTAPPASAVAAPGTTQRASVHDQTNAQAPRGGLSSVISGDGNSVAFVSTDSLDPSLDTRSIRNVYVRDLARNRTVLISRGQFTRQQPPPPTTTTFQGPGFAAEPLLNFNAAQQEPIIVPGEVPADDISIEPAISADGRFVAFMTGATNIVNSPADRRMILVCDRDPDADGDFDEPADPSQPNGARSYAYFRVTGQGTEGAYLSKLRLSADAGRIVWHQAVIGDGLGTDVRTAALTPAAHVAGPDESVPGTLPAADVVQRFDPVISGDGNHIVMRADYRYTGCEFNCQFHAIVSTDLRTAARVVTRVDIEFVDNEGIIERRPVSTTVEELVMRPAVNFDGTVIAFVGEQFTSGTSGGGLFSEFDEPNVYVVRVDYAAEPEEEVTESVIASRGNANQLVNGELPALSSDGRYLAFVTDSLNTHDGQDGQPNEFSCIRPEQVVELTGGRMLNLAGALPPERDAARTACQLVVRDLVLDRQRETGGQSRLAGTLVSPNQAGNAANGNTLPNRTFPPVPSLSADGSRVAFDSEATDLTPVGTDTNQAIDVFVRTLQPNARAEVVDFGPVQIGEAVTQSAAVEHVGAGPLTIGQVTLAGPNAADFTLGAQTCQAGPLHQTDGCFISVTFAPSAADERRAVLQVQLQGGRALTIDLVGTGTEQPVPPRGAEFSAGPDPLDFGPRLLLSTGPAATVTVTNQGGSPLRITSVTLVPPVGPADYAVTVNTCTGVDVPPGGQCQITVVFSPTLPGDRSAVLQFDDNAAGGPHLVGLRGQANAPAIEVNPGVTPPGRVTTVSGKDFPPGKTVTVTFRTAVGSSTVTVGSDGTFRASLLVFHKATPENRRIAATVDGLPALFAEDDLLVVFPTVSPADFVVRG
jgi:hypothetical protein